MQANVFLGGADPLLGSAATPYNRNDYDAKLAELQAMQERLEAQRKQSNYSQNGNSSPIWDEIEKLTTELTDREFDIINGSKDFQASQAEVFAVLQREYMRMMRPMVEHTADGKAALQKHLDTLRRLRKEAAREVDKNMELFNEYTQHYSDMTYSEFLKKKKANKKK